MLTNHPSPPFGSIVSDAQYDLPGELLEAVAAAITLDLDFLLESTVKWEPADDGVEVSGRRVFRLQLFTQGDPAA